MRFYRGLSPIQAMSFDLDDTLYDNHLVIRNLERELKTWLIERCSRLERFEQRDWLAFKRQAIVYNPNIKHDVTRIREQQLTLAFKAIGLESAEVVVAVANAMEQVYFLRNTNHTN